ncbi:MAG: TIGR02757 family protein [Bacteroidetes bacterium RIFOXYA12_FULL_35_11]|nr:MAG: TIGR02757 family protein [Bacteroidetes bacterium GWF2_35_48]OFY81682.1 MAG: TIGR02757 family protein [Bacteroidetes bacterium RIFOXYA12_FULL_35_11]OFY93670.1 MAG: TIGR02757 family protein [Bacteroidetes bacterium RIFOXYC12_FULL_35_7]OFY96384.1 MAG: TIGR02757 family protein [Bacteroidetes bacterium RIFOXYB2_FULL_35_7]HBX50256.1 TIGR02757 family protein [Bacteroidales bacterium]
MQNKLETYEIFNFLEEKAVQYNCSDFIDSDPVQIPHLFTKKEDIETSAFFASALAWGNRKAIIQSAHRLMERMDFSPQDFIVNSSAKEIDMFSDFKYRTFNGEDCKFFIRSLKNIYLKEGGLQAVFEKMCNKKDTIEDALIYFRNVFFCVPHQKRSEKHISDIAKKSAAKRLNLFLRWMVRKDKAGVDFGLWSGIRASQLLIPLDLHSGNVARKLGLLTREQNDLKAVHELMHVLRKFDANDPVKYDYALFGLGVFEKF